MSAPIRVLIADDHAIVRKGLRMIVSHAPDMEVVGEASNGSEAVEQAEASSPDVILMDLQMPQMGGVEAIQAIKQNHPTMKILVLTSFTDDENVISAIQSGASGYILKDVLPAELLEALRGVSQGKPSLHPMVAEKLMHAVAHPAPPPVPVDQLTPREREVLRLVAQGHNNHEIAQMLGIRERTVTTHVENILSKLHLANRTQAALYAVKAGLIAPP